MQGINMAPNPAARPRKNFSQALQVPLLCVASLLLAAVTVVIELVFVVGGITAVPLFIFTIASVSQLQDVVATKVFVATTVFVALTVWEVAIKQFAEPAGISKLNFSAGGNSHFSSVHT